MKGKVALRTGHFATDFSPKSKRLHYIIAVMKASSFSRKVILDLGPLGYSHDHKSGARGIHRLTQYLFEGLLAANTCELKFVATSHLAGVYDMLSDRGLAPQEVLKYEASQLRLSRLGRRAARWVHAHMGPPGLGVRAQRKLMASLAASACSGEKLIPSRFLKGADIYHSPLAPIPSSVRRHKTLKHFLTVHDLLPLTVPQYLKGNSRPYITKLLKSLSPESFVFCTSESVKSDLLTYSPVPLQHIFITPLAADRRMFYPVGEAAKISGARKKYGIPDAPYFLTLSSFDPRKNFEHIIRCFSTLVRSGQAKDFNLVIVGSNPERNQFVETAMTEHPHIQRQIIMPGFIPDEDLAAIYSGALSFLFPSLGEGFGIPVLEAMQCGTPVISSNTTSLPEVVGKAGILLDPFDIEAWCQAMISLSDNLNERNCLREQGIARAALFTWEKFIETTQAGYAFACNQT